MKKFYNINNISIQRNNKWIHGHDAIEHMRCIRSDGGNWDLIAVVPGCNSGFWGTVKYYKQRYGHDIPA